MNWTDPVDAYCERMGEGLWAEPVNAITNLAFILAAIWVWPNVRGDRGAALLCVSLASIGIASGLFHTLANQWSGAADSLSILVYILIYIFLASRRVLGLHAVVSVALVLLFVPYAAVTASVVGDVFGPMNGSTIYVAVAVLIILYGVMALDRKTGHGLLIGSAILLVSIAARSVDEAWCSAWPLGTHFLWHTLNGIMLGWMILVIHRASLAGTRARS